MRYRSVFRMAVMAGLASFALLPEASASPNTYYVGGTGASDGNAGSATAPFATIQACANVAMPGDTCIINSGVYHETVTPPRSGTATAPITFQAAENAQVTVDGADPVANWTNYQGSIYVASVVLPFTPFGTNSANQVFLDGQMMVEARWPATGPDFYHPTEAIMDSGDGSDTPGGVSTINSSELPAGNWVGSIVHVRSGAGWSAYTATISTYTAGVSLTFPNDASGAYNAPAKGGRFYLTAGPLSSLDAPAEWWYDGTEHLLYLWTPTGDSPSNHTIEAKQRVYGFDLSGQSYIHVVGMGLFGTTVITSPTSSYDVFDRLHALYVSHYQTIDETNPVCASPYCAHFSDSGFVINGTYDVVQNSRIRYSAEVGISLYGTNGAAINKGLS